MSKLPPQQSLIASPQHLTSSEIKPILQSSNIDEVFTIVRNPYSRLISEYKWSTRKLSADEAPIFNNWAIEQIRKASEDPNYNDNHIRPMVDFLDKDLPCRIFRYESGINIITEFYARDYILDSPPIGTVNQSSSLLPTGQERTDAEFLETLSHEAIALINDFYKDDFSEFSYQMLNFFSTSTNLHSSRSDQNLPSRQAVNSQECMALMSHKLQSARTSIVSLRRRDLEGFTEQLSKSEASVQALRLEQDKITAQLRDLQADHDQLLSQYQILTAERDQLTVQLQQSRKEGAEAHREASEILEKLQKALEDLEKYYVLSNTHQYTLQQTSEELDQNRAQLKHSLNLHQSRMRVEEHMLRLVTRITLVSHSNRRPQVNLKQGSRPGPLDQMKPLEPPPGQFVVTSAQDNKHLSLDGKAS